MYFIRADHQGVLVLKYDTLGAKLLKCTAVQVGVKSAKVGLPARQTATVADKQLISGL